MKRKYSLIALLILIIILLSVIAGLIGYLISMFDRQSFNNPYYSNNFIGLKTSGDNIDYIDQISDLHEPSDIGFHSSFNNLQNQDDLWDDITEMDNASFGISNILNVSSFSGDTSSWSKTGGSPYLDKQDEPTNIIYTASNNAIDKWYGFDDYIDYYSTYNVIIFFYCKNDDGVSNDYFEVYMDRTGIGSGILKGSIYPDTTYNYYSIDLGIYTDTSINSLRMELKYIKVGGGDDVYIDYIYLNATGIENFDYDLDLEMGWLNANYEESNEVLCIYADMSEIEALVDSFSVDVWDDGSNQWINVISELVENWNNVSVSSYLVDNTFEIRIVDEYSSDSQKDVFSIDSILLHTWTPPKISYDNLYIYYNPIIIDFNEIISIDVYSTGLVINVSFEILLVNYTMVNIYNDTWLYDDWNTSLIGVFSYIIHMNDDNDLYAYVIGEIAVYDPTAITLTVMTLIILIGLLALQLILYLRLKPSLAVKFPLIAVVYLFGLIINVSSIGSSLPLTPMIQFFLIVFETVIFLITSLDYYKTKDSYKAKQRDKY